MAREGGRVRKEVRSDEWLVASEEMKVGARRESTQGVVLVGNRGYTWRIL